MSEKGAIEPGRRVCTVHVHFFLIYSPQITSKNLYSKNGADFIRMYRNQSTKIKKLSRPQGTEKLGDTTLINATAFTHPTVNAGATPGISRNSETGSIKGNAGILQPDKTHRYSVGFLLCGVLAIYYFSSQSLHIK